jgi:IPT/TIG domain
MTRRSKRFPALLLALALGACGDSTGTGTPPVDESHPAPTLTALSVDSATVGTATPPVVVATGTGFTARTLVLWNGQELATVYRGPTEVSFQPPLGEVGAASVSVRNPAPGGGTSAAVPFAVLAPFPVITLLPSRGAVAGGPGFTLTVHGTGFLNGGSTVRWNGEPRPTTFVSGTRLQATLSAADLAAPGPAAVTVVNAGPVARASAAATFTVRPLGAATVDVRRVDLHGNDLVWDAGTARLYVSVGSGGGARANTVTRVDPQSGAVTESVAVGSEPRLLALSDDGRYLYVGLNGASAVRRVTLATLAPGLQWSVGEGMVAGDLEVAPGQPGTVAVSIHRPGFSPPLQGVRIYDEGVARAQSSPGHTGAAAIEYLESPSALYGYDASGSFRFYTLVVDGTGAQHVQQTEGLLQGFYTDIVGAAGRVYGYDGSVVDAQRHVRVGRFVVSGASRGYALAPDPATGRAYMLVDDEILVYDMNTFQLIGTLDLSGHLPPQAVPIWTTLVRWGSDGLAFLYEDALFIVRSPLVAP